MFQHHKYDFKSSNQDTSLLRKHSVSVRNTESTSYVVLLFFSIVIIVCYCIVFLVYFYIKDSTHRITYLPCIGFCFVYDVLNIIYKVEFRYQ